jgi:hypothetical protein
MILQMHNNSPKGLDGDLRLYIVLLMMIPSAWSRLVTMWDCHKEKKKSGPNAMDGVGFTLTRIQHITIKATDNFQARATRDRFYVDVL